MIKCFSFFRSCQFPESDSHESLYNIFNSQCRLPFHIDSTETKLLKSILKKSDYQFSAKQFGFVNHKILKKDIAELFLAKQALSYWQDKRKGKSQRTDKINAFAQEINEQYNQCIIRLCGEGELSGDEIRHFCEKHLTPQQYNHLEGLTKIKDLGGIEATSSLSRKRTWGLNCFRTFFSRPAPSTIIDFSNIEEQQPSRIRNVGALIFAPLLDFSFDCLNIFCDNCSIWLDLVKVY